MIGNTIAGPAKALVNFELSTNVMFGGSPTIIQGFEISFDGWLFHIILGIHVFRGKFCAATGSVTMLSCYVLAIAR